MAPHPACPTHPDPETLASVTCAGCGAFRLQGGPLCYFCVHCGLDLRADQLVTSAVVGRLLVTLHRDCWAARTGIDPDADPVGAFQRWLDNAGWSER